MFDTLEDWFYSVPGRAFGLVVLGITIVGSADAQTYTSPPERDAQVERRNGERGQGGVGDLPAWAEPREPSRTSPQGENLESGVSAKNGPGLPGDPQSTPVDGGLIWLVLAGGGYASWKLGRENDEPKF